MIETKASPLGDALLTAMVDGADRWLRDRDLLDASPLATLASSAVGEECERLACRHVTGLWRLDPSVDRRRLCFRDAARRLRRRDRVRQQGNEPGFGAALAAAAGHIAAHLSLPAVSTVEPCYRGGVRIRVVGRHCEGDDARAVAGPLALARWARSLSAVRATYAMWFADHPTATGVVVGEIDGHRVEVEASIPRAAISPDRRRDDPAAEPWHYAWSLPVRRSPAEVWPSPEDRVPVEVYARPGGEPR